MTEEIFLIFWERETKGMRVKKKIDDTFFQHKKMVTQKNKK